MTVRSRMTLWYAGILLFSILLILGISINALLNRQREAQKEAEAQNKLHQDSKMDWDDPVEPEVGVNWKDVVMNTEA